MIDHADTAEEYAAAISLPFIGPHAYKGTADFQQERLKLISHICAMMTPSYCLIHVP